MLMVLPGSRKGEITRIGPVLGDVVQRVVSENSGMRIVVPVAPGKAQMVADITKDWAGVPILVAPDDTSGRQAAFKAADVALAASGTVALELAANSTPMVIAYDFNPLTRAILKRMLITDSVNLVNLVSESRVVPEFLNEDCRAEKIAPAVSALMTHPDLQADAMSMTMQRLGLGGEAPGLRAARAVRAVVTDRASSN